MKTFIKNSLVVISIMILFVQMISPCIMAANIGETYYLERGNRGFYTLKRASDDVYITYEIVYYNNKEGNQKQIAYCLDPNLSGIGWSGGSIQGYNVTLTENLSKEGYTNTNGIPYVKIWRICINGYPYKQPADLGVETEEDAYFATKIANYAVLKGYTADSIGDYVKVGDASIRGQSIEDIQRRGQKVFNAIVNLVTIANDESIQPVNSNNINVNEVDKLQKNKNTGYCSQEYSVTSSISIQNYTITGLNNFPTGTKVTDLNGNEKSTFNNGENFKVLIPEQELMQDINGTIDFSIKCESYPIYFGASNSEYQNYAICGGTFGDITKTVPLNINCNSSAINITKLDGNTSAPLPNVTFELVKDGKVIATSKTGSNGIVEFKNLCQGTYIVREVKTNDNYVLNKVEKEVTIGFDETIYIQMDNYKKKGKIQVIKVDKDDNNIRLPGVTFEVLDEQGNIVQTIKTNANGEATTGDLPIDKIYTVREKETTEKYVLSNEEQTIKLEYDKTTTLQFENELKKGQIKVVKVDAENKEIKLEGVEFQVLDLNGNVKETIVTNQDGYAISSRLPIGIYTIKETKTNNDYELNEEIFQVEVKTDNVSELEIANKKIKKLPKTGF